MTFTEAALEVLRSAGEPLHYKKITELAIERNLLSHVGKTPEVTMSSRLAMMVKKDRGQAPIIKVKPGVFAIRESALQGQSLSPAALAAISEIEGLGSTGTVDESAVAAEPTAAEEQQPIKTPLLPGADVFPEEEGDDDPILAGLEQESEQGERAGRRRRRRRRRGKGDKPDAPAEVSLRPEAPREQNRERPREAFRERTRQDRHERPDRQDRTERTERSDRNHSPHGSNDRDRDRDRERPERAALEDRQRNNHSQEDLGVDWNRQPGEGDLLGKDLADAVWAVLSRGDRNPHSFSRVAELLVRRGRLSGAANALAPTIAAAVRADIARAELTRSRPRFRLRGGRLSLSEWLLPKNLARAEQDLLAGAERYAAELRRALIQKLSELPTAGFAELLATWLNAEGVTALRAVRRPGSSGSELHFAGTRKSGSEEVRLAIVVQRSGRDIDREAVIDVRGALHHYGQAQSAWLVTLGRITSGAREEAGAQAAACALFDGNALATAMERLGIAMRRHVIAHHEMDYDLLESLGDSPEQRERREQERDRDRRQQFGERERAQAAPTRSDSSAPQAALGGEREARESGPPPVKLRDADWDVDDVDDETEADAPGVQARNVPVPPSDSGSEGAVEDLDSGEEDDETIEEPDLDAEDLKPSSFREDIEEVDEEVEESDEESEDSDESDEDEDEEAAGEVDDEYDSGEHGEDEELDEEDEDEESEGDEDDEDEEESDEEPEPERS